MPATLKDSVHSEGLYPEGTSCLDMKTMMDLHVPTSCITIMYILLVLGSIDT